MCENNNNMKYKILMYERNNNINENNININENVIIIMNK